MGGLLWRPVESKLRPVTSGASYDAPRRRTAGASAHPSRSSPAIGARSLDHLVGAGEQCGRYGKAEHPGCLRVDYQLELGRLHDRQLGRLRAFEDAAGVDADLTIGIRQARSVAHEPAGFREAAKRIYRWDRMSRSQEDQLDPPIGEKSTGRH